MMQDLPIGLMGKDVKKNMVMQIADMSSGVLSICHSGPAPTVLKSLVFNGMFRMGMCLVHKLLCICSC